MSEYQLIQNLNEPLSDWYNGHQLKKEQSPELKLFQSHFLVMNALYQLQDKFAGSGYFLYISPLSIHLQDSSQISDEQKELDFSENTLLRSYYLDWNNFEQTGEGEVDNLLNSFWQRYLLEDKQLEALQVLGLNHDASWHAIQDAYRLEAKKTHPDSGGSAEEFIVVREAYEILHKIYSGNR